MEQYTQQLWSIWKHMEDHCTKVNNIFSPQIIYFGMQNATLFGNKVLPNTLAWDHAGLNGLKSNDWCPFRKRKWHRDAKTQGLRSWKTGQRLEWCSKGEGRNAKDTKSLQEEAYVFLELSWAADAADKLILNIYPAGLWENKFLLL